MYSQLILKRASAEGLTRMAEMTVQDAYAYGKLWRKRNGTFRTEVIQCANELIRREIDRECNALALQGFSCWPHEVAQVHARNIIALRTWESQLQ